MNKINKKIILLISLVLHILSTYSQATRKIFYEDHVECYFDNGISDSLKVYDTIDGHIIASLKIEKGAERRRWFKIAIQETRNGWARIENIMIAPGLVKSDSLNDLLDSLKERWIKLENLKINIADMSLPDSMGVPFYTKPNIHSELVCKSGKFLRLTLLDTQGLWAKVTFIHHNTKYIAWIERKNQCAYPWTSCPFYP